MESEEEDNKLLLPFPFLFSGFYSKCVEGIEGDVKVDEVMMARVKEKKLATQARPKDTTQRLSCRVIGAL